MSPRNEQPILERIAKLELEADNARMRGDFQAVASFRFLAVLTREQFRQ